MNLIQETEAVREGFRRELERLPHAIAEQSGAVRSRMRIRSGKARGDDDWIDEFSDVTRLYPLLQSEGFAFDREDVVRANVAHVFLLVYAFIEDRIEDGQVAPTEEDVAFKDAMYDRAMVLLRELKRSNPSSREKSGACAVPFIAPVGAGVREAVLVEVAPKKANLGWLATFTLLRANSVAGQEIERLAGAYDALVTGLQYADDLEDWREDLDRAEDNLVLARLCDGGLDPYSLPKGQYRIPNVGHAMLRTGAVECAVRSAGAYFEAAQRRYESAGCTTLAGCAESIQRALNESVGRIRERIENELMVACLIANTVDTQRNV